MDKKFIYVCLSECKKVVKVGISYNVNTRVTGLKTSEGTPFKVVFCSKEVLLDRALEIEKEVTAKFKENLIKGKEWYDIKPIHIIEFLINELNVEPYEMGEIKTQFPHWRETMNEHKAYKDIIEFPHIKEKQQKGYYSIAYMDKDEYKYIGFCNYGDAKKFFYDNKIFVLMADNIVEDLYGIPVTELHSLQISSKRNIYGLKEQVLKVKDKLLYLLKLAEM